MRFEGNQTLVGIAEILRKSEEYIGGPGRFDVRCVATRAGNSWFNHVTLVHFGLALGEQRPTEVIRLGAAILFRSQFEGESEMSAERLQQISTAWQESAGLQTRRQLQDQAFVQRVFFRRPRSRALARLDLPPLGASVVSGSAVWRPGTISRHRSGAIRI
jgi:hypothetical protein